ncbi:MAG: metallophosphoesterase [Candidatus Magasanikbacteria bacterium]|nr:metallophosphoesterase [Candidatus Magasanikbacteria bacterium]
MNPITVIIYGYILTALLLVYFIIRDLKIPGLFFNRKKILGYSIVFILIFGIFIALYSHLLEPFILVTKTVEIHDAKIKQPLKIAFVADIQVGNHKKSEWVEKIVEKIIAQNPDLVIFGGDLIDNEGTFENESKYLEPLRKIAEKYPSFYVLGNHEYGLGQPNLANDFLGTGNRSEELIIKMKELNITLLRNTLDCLEIQNQNICLFGIDDIYAGKNNYSALKNFSPHTPLIFITHNPDGILSYPENFPKPILTLAGHTHGGQVYLPIFGPLGSADLILPDIYYKGLNSWQGVPIYTSVGSGESGGQIRFLVPPEIVFLNLKP